MRFFKRKTEERQIPAAGQGIQGAPISGSMEDILGRLGAANTAAGEHIGYRNAEALPAVLNAVAVISDAVASLPLRVYTETQRNGQISREWLPDNQVDFLLNVKPNDTMTPFTAKRILMRNVLLSGNGIAVIKWDNRGQPKALIPVDSGRVSITRVGDYKYAYEVTEPHSGKSTTYGAGDILHLRHASNDGFLGRSPITVCREALGLAMAQQNHGASIMRNGLMAGGILTVPDFLDSVKGKQALDALDRYRGAKNAGKIPVLEGGMQLQLLGMNNSDAEWLASRQFSLEDVARIFGISPIFLQDYRYSTYSNFTEASRAFATLTLRPFLNMFEQEIRHSLLPAAAPRGSRFEVQFDTAELLRASPQERYASYETAIKSGVMNPNECRSREGLPAYEGGEKFSQAWLQQANLTPAANDSGTTDAGAA